MDNSMNSDEINLLINEKYVHDENPSKLDKARQNYVQSPDKLSMSQQYNNPQHIQDLIHPKTSLDKSLIAYGHQLQNQQLGYQQNKNKIYKVKYQGNNSQEEQQQQQQQQQSTINYNSLYLNQQKELNQDLGINLQRYQSFQQISIQELLNKINNNKQQSFETQNINAFTLFTKNYVIYSELFENTLRQQYKKQVDIDKQFKQAIAQINDRIQNKTFECFQHEYQSNQQQNEINQTIQYPIIQALLSQVDIKSDQIVNDIEYQLYLSIMGVKQLVYDWTVEDILLITVIIEQVQNSLQDQNLQQITIKRLQQHINQNPTKYRTQSQIMQYLNLQQNSNIFQVNQQQNNNQNNNNQNNNNNKNNNLDAQQIKELINSSMSDNITKMQQVVNQSIQEQLKLQQNQFDLKLKRQQIEIQSKDDKNNNNQINNNNNNNNNNQNQNNNWRNNNKRTNNRFQQKQIQNKGQYHQQHNQNFQQKPYNQKQFYQNNTRNSQNQNKMRRYNKQQFYPKNNNQRYNNNNQRYNNNVRKSNPHNNKNRNFNNNSHKQKFNKQKYRYQSKPHQQGNFKQKPPLKQFKPYHKHFNNKKSNVKKQHNNNSYKRNGNNNNYYKKNQQQRQKQPQYKKQGNNNKYRNKQQYKKQSNNYRFKRSNQKKYKKKFYNRNDLLKCSKECKIDDWIKCNFKHINQQNCKFDQKCPNRKNCILFHKKEPILQLLKFCKYGNKCADSLCQYKHQEFLRTKAILTMNAQQIQDHMTQLSIQQQLCNVNKEMFFLQQITEQFKNTLFDYELIIPQNYGRMIKTRKSQQQNNIIIITTDVDLIRILRKQDSKFINIKIIENLGQYSILEKIQHDVFVSPNSTEYIKNNWKDSSIIKSKEIKCIDKTQLQEFEFLVTKCKNNCINITQFNCRYARIFDQTIYKFNDELKQKAVFNTVILQLQYLNGAERKYKIKFYDETNYDAYCSRRDKIMNSNLSIIEQNKKLNMKYNISFQTQEQKKKIQNQVRQAIDVEQPEVQIQEFVQQQQQKSQEDYVNAIYAQFCDQVQITSDLNKNFDKFDILIQNQQLLTETQKSQLFQQCLNLTIITVKVKWQQDFKVKFQQIAREAKKGMDIMNFLLDYIGQQQKGRLDQFSIG